MYKPLSTILVYGTHYASVALCRIRQAIWDAEYRYLVAFKTTPFWPFGLGLSKVINPLQNATHALLLSDSFPQAKAIYKEASNVSKQIFAGVSS